MSGSDVTHVYKHGSMITYQSELKSFVNKYSRLKIGYPEAQNFSVNKPILKDREKLNVPNFSSSYTPPRCGAYESLL